MNEENKFIAFLKKLFFKEKPYNKEESDKLKRKMCFEARVNGLCKEPNCNWCAWRVD